MDIKNKHKKILEQLLAYKDVAQVVSALDALYNDWEIRKQEDVEKTFRMVTLRKEYGFSFDEAERAVKALQDFLIETSD